MNWKLRSLLPMKWFKVEDVVCSGIGFLNADAPLPGLDGRTVGGFWRWAYSDVLSNRNRSVFAEFMVGVALGVVDKPRVPNEPLRRFVAPENLKCDDSSIGQ